MTREDWSSFLLSFSRARRLPARNSGSMLCPLLPQLGCYRASGAKDKTSLSASSVSSSKVDGSWGFGSSCLSAWISDITASLSRTALRVSSPASRGRRWIMGGAWGGGGGGNGTDNGASSESWMGDGEGDNGGGNGRVSGIPSSSTRDIHSPPGGVQPLKGSLGLLPWMWVSALWTFYLIWLEKFPLMTKAMTAGFLALGGDLVAQCFEYRRGDSKDPPGKVTNYDIVQYCTAACILYLLNRSLGP